MFLRFSKFSHLILRAGTMPVLETYVSSIPYGIEKCKVEFVKMHKGFFFF